MDNSLVKKIHFGSYLLLAFLPFITAKLVPLSIGVWLLINLSIGFIEIKNNGWKSIKPLLVQSSLFVLIFFYTIFLDGSKEAHFYLERTLSLLIFPVGFYFSPFKLTNKQLNIIKITFAGSTIFITVLYSVFTLINLTKNIGMPGWYPTLDHLLKAHNFHYHFRNGFEVSSGFHPTYASLYLGLSFIFILNLFINHFKEINKNRVVWTLVSLFLILVLMASLASRTPFIATILVCLLLVFLKLKKKIYALYGLAFVVVLSGVLFTTIPSFSARFSQISFSNTKLPTNKDNKDSFNLRTGILHCTIELIKENWLVGVGPANVQQQLDNCYMNIAPEAYKDESFNTHNQFLSFWAGMGLLGLLTFLFILFKTSYQGIKNKSVLPLIVCLFFSLCFLTENIMVRQQGIVVVTFFINLFYFSEHPFKTKSKTN